jgi:hypothetical protein
MKSIIEHFQQQFNDLDKLIEALNIRADDYSKVSTDLKKQVSDNIEKTLNLHNDKLNKEFQSYLSEVHFQSIQIQSMLLWMFANLMSEYRNVQYCMKLNTIKASASHVQQINNSIIAVAGDPPVNIDGLISSKGAGELNASLMSIIEEVSNEVKRHSVLHEQVLRLFIHEHLQENVDLTSTEKLINAINVLIEESNKNFAPDQILTIITRLVELNFPITKELFKALASLGEVKFKHPIQSVEPTSHSYEQGVISLNSKLERLKNTLEMEQEVVKQAFIELSKLYFE